MALDSWPSTELPASPNIDNFNWMTSAPEETLQADNFHKPSFDANQFDLVDFGLVNLQKPHDIMDAFPELPQATRIHTETGVGKLDSVEDCAELFQNDLNQKLGAPPVSEIPPDNFAFDFEFPVSTNASTRLPPQNMPGYVPFTAQSSANYRYPPPPEPAMDIPNPYPTLQSYPWDAAPTIPPLFQYNFGNMTPPSKQVSSFDTSFLMSRSVDPPGAPHFGRKYNPIRKLIDSDEPGPDDFALSSPGKTGKRRVQPRSSLDDTRVTKKARRARIKNFLVAQANLQRTKEIKNNGNESNGSVLSSLPPSPIKAKRPVRMALRPDIGESDADAEADDDSDFDHPTNTINASYGRQRRSAALLKPKMEAIKARRRAYFQIPQDPSPEPLGPSVASRTSPLRIQARRRKNPGRKITVPQTPEVIARNAARRERYRMSLAPARRALYDAATPGTVNANEV